MNQYLLNYLNLVNGYLENNNKENLIQANLLGKEIEEKNYLKEDKIFISMKKDLDNFNEDNFLWKHVDFLDVKLQIVDEFCKLIKNKNSSLLEYLDYNVVHKILDINLILCYLKKEYFFTNNEKFHTILKFQSCLLKIFSFFYIEMPLIKLNRITVDSISLIDPLSRVFIRKNNLANKYSEYLIKNLEIKQLIYSFFDFFFPSFSWFYLKKDINTFKEVFNIVFILFEFGLFIKSELDELIKLIYSKIDILKNLEKNSENEYDKIEDEELKNQISILFPETKEILSAILIHIIIWYNDDSFFQEYNNKVKIKSVNKDYLKNFDDYIFMNEKIYTIYNFIILNFLFSKNNFSKENENYNLLRNLNQLFLIIIDYKHDCFLLSFKILDKDFIRFVKEFKLDNNATIVNEEINKFLELLQIENLDDEKIVQNLDKLSIDLKKNETNKKFIYSINTNNGLMKILSILSFINDIKKNKYYTKTIEIITILEKYFNNKQVQNILIGNQGKTYLNRIYKNYKNELLFFLINNYLNNIKAITEDNQNFNLKILFEYYESLIKELTDKLKENEIDKINKINISIIYLFNKLFDVLLSSKNNFTTKKTTIDLLIQKCINPYISIILKIFSDPNYLKISEKEYSFESILFTVKSNSFLDYKSIINKSDKKLLIYEICYSLLKIYLKSCKDYYLKESFENMNNKRYLLKETLFFFKFKQGLKLRMIILDIFNLFEVFFNNNWFNDRLSLNKGDRNYNEIHIPLKMVDLNIETKIRCEIENLQEYFSKFEGSFDEDDIFSLKKYIYSGFFPIIYKYCSGILKLIEPNDTNFKTFNKKIKGIITELNKNFPFLKKVFKLCGLNEKDINLINNEFKTIKFIKKQNENKLVNNILAKKVADIERKKKRFKTKFQAKTEDKEELIYPNLCLLRRNINKLLCIIESIYETNGFQAQINSFSLDDNIDYENVYINKYEDKEGLDKEISEYNNNFWIEKTIDSKNILNYTKLYRNIKKYLILYKSENIFLKVIKSEINRKDNSVENIFKFFLSFFKNINLNYKGDIFESFNINSFYFALINIINILLKWKDQIKSIFFVYLRKNPEEAQVFFNNLWHLYKESLFFISYKPFRDKIWKKRYKDFNLITDFLQNCCENHFIAFKYFFNDLKINGNSFVTEYFSLIEDLSFFTKSIVNKENFIAVSDRKDTFIILGRMFYCISEFVNGPCVENQNILYKNSINNWVNILTRIINDIKSDFYSLKLNIIYYISGLIEGNNSETNKFIAANLDPNEIFEIIRSLIKKLYVYQIKLNKGDKNSVIKDKDERNNIIDNPEDLIDFYLNHEETFSNNIIILICIELYKIIYHVGGFSRIFNNFIKNKEKNLVDFKNKLKIDRKYSYLENNENLNDNQANYLKNRKPGEELIIFKFLNLIVSKIEIIDNNDELKNLFYPLVPKIFFLSNKIKKDFLDNLYSVEDKKDEIINNNYIYFEIEKNYSIYKKSHFLYFISNGEFLNFVQIILLLISLVMNILFLAFYSKENDNSNSIWDPSIVDVISYFNLALIIISGIFLIIWIIFNYRYIRKLELERFSEFKKKRKNKLLKLYDSFIVNIYKSLLTQEEFFIFLLHFIFGFLGFFKIYVFMSFNLYIFIFHFVTLKTIIKSIIQHWEQLLLSLILAMIIVYTFSILTIEFFRNEIIEDTELCENLVMCFFNLFSYGLRVGLHEYFQVREYNERFFGTRFVYDMLFFFFVNLIFINIIAGIIIDTFANKRDEFREIENLKKNECLICGLNRYVLEKNKISFSNHINIVHQPFKYIFFLIYLRNKNFEDYTGDEVRIKLLIDDNKNDWIPNKKTIELRGKFENDKKNNLEKIFNEIMDKLKELN